MRMPSFRIVLVSEIVNSESAVAYQSFDQLAPKANAAFINAVFVVGRIQVLEREF